MTDITLPRTVPIDPQVPPEFQQQYITVTVAAKAAGVYRSTIKRHLGNGTLRGKKMATHLWYVSRTSNEGESPPGLDWWTPGTSGNPNWIKE